MLQTLTGLHLEIDPRGGKMSIFEKEGGRSPVYMVHNHLYTRGVWGYAPLDFRLSETASGAFSGTDFVLNREIFDLEAIHCRLAISKG